MTTLLLNNELNGIEISFDSKPSSDILTTLKSIGFRWHNKKKVWYAKNTEERLEAAKAIVNDEPIKSEVKAKEEPKNYLGVQVGDVFYDSWGYEQTNIDFYQVVALRGTKQIVLRKIGGKKTEDCGYCSYMVAPVKDNFVGEPIRKTVKGTTDHPYCNSEYSLLTKTTWDAEHNETSYY